MFGNAEAGEGIGFIRPVYDFDYWNTNALGFVRDWRFGGGAGEMDFDLPSKDTDTRDPNAIDIIVGAGQTQAAGDELAEHSPVALPMVPLGRLSGRRRPGRRHRLPDRCRRTQRAAGDRHVHRGHAR